MREEKSSGTRAPKNGLQRVYSRTVGGLILQAIFFGILAAVFASVVIVLIRLLAETRHTPAPHSYPMIVTLTVSIAALSATAAVVFGYRVCAVWRLRLIEDPRKNAIWVGCAGAVGACIVTWKYLVSAPDLAPPMAVPFILALQAAVVMLGYAAGARIHAETRAKAEESEISAGNEAAQGPDL